MPCRWPTDNELYQQSSIELAKQKWVNRETEEALCNTSTLLIKILSDPRNSITLQSDESEQVQEIRTQHLEHRVEELTLLRTSLKREIPKVEKKLEDLKKTRQQHEAQWFDANEIHMQKEWAAQQKIWELQERIITLGQILESVKNNDTDTIQKVLTKTQ